ncbi:class C beta-lactamase [Pantoea allii]|nr:beta-lactamase [Pantoea allii]MBW1262255.1 beta-lactamase [Pantoea allii]MBW1283384.1 beta-lactamase [Pantoea allii]ORM87307.1 class C beta-lactamase [Pantoea allii]PBK02000.1 class C beta-lactamase [Pantoea allii]
MKRYLTALLVALSASSSAADLSSQDIASRVKNIITPLMEQEGIPGMSVAVLYKGRPQYLNFGVADTASDRRVTENTLFELGSVSKTFTGVLAGVMMRNSQLHLNDPVQKYWPALKGPQWQAIKMVHLATYSAGGMPLQLPASVTDQDTLLTYLQQWQPDAAPGTQRRYSNISLGLLGYLMIKGEFEEAMQKNVFTPLRLTRTFYRVPASMMFDYAWGYKDGQPVRVSPGMLSAETYGVKSTARDMMTFMQANANPNGLSSGNTVLRNGMITAQSRYLTAGKLSQGLGWEIYPWPMATQTIVDASDNNMALQAQPATLLNPPKLANRASWIHKTGSTNGFGAYIVFIPQLNSGVVMLANKNYPNPARIKAAAAILEAIQ